VTRVDFYILPDVDRAARGRFACRLAYRAWGEGLEVHVHVDDADSARDLDGLMWEYPAEQFLPHARIGDPAADVAPVSIDYRPQPRHRAGLLINLSSGVPAFFDRFDRVAEVIVAPDRNQGRDRYRFYRHDGYPLFHHELDDWEA